MGVNHVYLTGYTPYPTDTNDERLPHLRDKISHQINKTALGASELVPWSHHNSAEKVISELKNDGYIVVALEQMPNSIQLPDWSPPDKLAILLGREVEGISSELIELCEMVVEIPQFGHKESLNIVQATAMVLYHARFVQVA